MKGMISFFKSHWFGFFMAALFWCMAVTAVDEKSATFDETGFITAGYSSWHTRDYRLNPENGIFPQMLATWPLLFDKPEFPHLNQQAWWGTNIWAMAYEFLNGLGNDQDAMLRRCRAMSASFGVGLVLMVYFWSCQLYGKKAAWISTIACAFCPSLLAHGALITCDIAVTFFLALATWSWWTVLHRMTFLTLLGCGVSVGLLLVSKMSGILFFPIAMLVWTVRWWNDSSLCLDLGSPVEIRRKSTILKMCVLAMILICGISVFIIWSMFNFRYPVVNYEIAPPEHHVENTWPVISGVKGKVIEFARQRHLLPEAYLFGVDYVFRTVTSRNAFLDGSYSKTGWWYFFPLAILYKTPIALFLLLGAGAFGLKFRRESGESFAWKQNLYKVSPLLTLLIVYFSAAISSGLNIGHRHIMPVYPVFYILAGTAVCWMAHSSRILRGCIVALPILLIIESLTVRPHYLTFFNLASGGSQTGYRHLVDSSFDWGQDLKNLKKWLGENGLENQTNYPVYLSYFGTADWRYYNIQAKRLPGYMMMGTRDDRLEPLTGGVYCISATMLQNVWLSCWGSWNKMYETSYQQFLPSMLEYFKAQKDPATEMAFLQKWGADWHGRRTQYEDLRVARLCAYLRKRKPDAAVGNSILLFYLSGEEVYEAIYGPPAELKETPGIKGM